MEQTSTERNKLTEKSILFQNCKEANETSYWLSLLVKTNIIDSSEYDRLENLYREIRITLIASINTAKSKKTRKIKFY